MNLPLAPARVVVPLVSLLAVTQIDGLPHGAESLRVSAGPAPAIRPPYTHGHARMVHPPTPCDVPTFAPGGPGAPYFVSAGVPHAGQSCRVVWTPGPTMPAEPPALPAFLMVSLRRVDPRPMGPAGATDCYLMVEPDFIMVPKPGSILTQSGGTVRLDWTPHESVIGQDFYGQLLVYAPGVNPAGFLVSPMLHVVVGS